MLKFYACHQLPILLKLNAICLVIPLVRSDKVISLTVCVIVVVELKRFDWDLTSSDGDLGRPVKISNGFGRDLNTSMKNNNKSWRRCLTVRGGGGECWSCGLDQSNWVSDKETCQYWVFLTKTFHQLPHTWNWASFG